MLYDWAGRPSSVASSSIDSGAAATFAYRNDGLLDTRAWSGTNATASVSYDAAKRPTSIAITGSSVAAASISESYDRNGNVATEGRSFSGISGASGTGTATFTNDQLNRVTADSISGGNSYAYAYDPDGNRTSVTINARTPTVSTYDTTDQLLTEGPQGGTLLSFNYDPHGNMVQSAETFNTGVTTYTYDLGDRLTKITPPSGLSGAQTFTLDALGRIATETTGSTTTTLSYVGTSKTVSRLATGSTNVDSLLGSDGSRLATTSGSSFGWLIPDLHGDIAGASSASLGTVTDALRYDAFGTIAASTTSALPTPWRYQGELLVSPAGASDLYADGARFYAPGLGVFTQLDTDQGSALNPLSLNRFLYAAANPETMIDPSGHTTIDEGDAYNSTLVHDSTHKHTTTKHLSGIQKYPGVNWKKDEAERTAERKQQLADDRAHFAQLRHTGEAGIEAQDAASVGVEADRLSQEFASHAASDAASAGKMTGGAGGSLTYGGCVGASGSGAGESGQAQGCVVKDSTGNVGFALTWGLGGSGANPITSADVGGSVYTGALFSDAKAVKDLGGPFDDYGGSGEVEVGGGGDYSTGPSPDGPVHILQINAGAGFQAEVHQIQTTTWVITPEDVVSALVGFLP